MDFGWKFHKGDVDYKPSLNHMRTYHYTKSESGMGPASLDFYDGDWRSVDLPHDYVVEGKPDPAFNNSHGSLARDNAWYRLTFKLDPQDHDKRVSLLFDGVATKCAVWVNGHPLTRNFTGGTSFDADFTDFANYGEEVNVVSVYIDNSEFEGWYYEGGGIYRHVWLIKTEKTAVGLWGTFIQSSMEKDDLWKSEIETTVLNDNYTNIEVSVFSEIVDPHGAVAARAESQATLGSRAETIVKHSAWVRKPELWSIEEPTLYTLNTYVIVDGEQVDDYQTVFGFRTISFDADTGFFLNGRNVKILGMANHQDNGCLGVALPDRVHEFRIKRLKEMGSNAYRCAHHPHAPEIYDACDRLGMLVMDETRWFDSSQEGLRQLASMMKRDRNHPSIIMWSVMNEEPIAEREAGLRIISSMADVVRKMDATRPATAAFYLGVLTPGMGESLDIIGINYQLELFDVTHKMYPHKPILSSESGQGFNPYGIDSWRQVDVRPYIMGIFPWTGLAYRGESRWPRLINSSGPIDQCGLPVNAYYMYKAYWTDEPFANIDAHWNWDGREGEKIEVVVFTNGDSAELFLNGRSLGEKAVDPYEMVKWAVAYEPGALKVIVKKAGLFHSEYVVETTGKPVKIKLVLEEAGVKADGEDVAIVTAYAVDAQGRVVPTANDYLIEFSANEFGSILAAGSSSEGDHDICTEPRSRTFRGFCQVFVKSSDNPGRLIVKAACEKLEGAEMAIDRGPCTRRPYVKPENNRFIPLWKMSPVYKQSPDIDVIAKEDGTDSWVTVEAGHGSQSPFEGIIPRYYDLTKDSKIDLAFVAYRADCIVPGHDFGDRDAVLHFERIEGRVEVIAAGEGKRVGKKGADFIMGPMDVELPGFKPGDKVTIWVIIQGHATEDSMNRPVRWIFK